VSVAHLHSDPDPAADWLNQLYGTAEAGWLTLFSVNPSAGDRHVDWAPASDTATLVAAAAQRSNTCDVWFGVATRKERLAGGKRGGDKDCLEVPGLWLDVDIAGPNHKTNEALPPDEQAAIELIRSFILPPTAVVHTGGGLHAYWLFNEMRAVSDLADMLPRWGATWARLADVKGWHLDNVFDPARVLRLPGTWNRKNDPTPVAVLERWLQ
jgi:hypothetical protein